MINSLPLSLCMVVWNEAHRLGPMLAWHRPLVGQIVIVVQESDDDTLAIARDLADVVLEHPRHGYCEASREAASMAAAFDTQLVLDADEWLTVAGAFALPRMVNATRHGDVDGYRLRRTLWVDGGHHFTGDAHYRLVHRRAVWMKDEIHTEPQIKKGCSWERIPSWGGDTPEGPGGAWAPEQLTILHVKTTAEQVTDELRTEQLLGPGGKLAGDPLAKRKLGLNSFLEAQRAKT